MVGGGRFGIGRHFALLALGISRPRGLSHAQLLWDSDHLPWGINTVLSGYDTDETANPVGSVFFLWALRRRAWVPGFGLICDHVLLSGLWWSFAA